MRLLDRPAVRARFAEAMGANAAPTPWTTSRSDPGVIRDATHKQVAVVDFDVSDPAACSIANMICLAVNACAARVEQEESTSCLPA